MHLGPGRFFPSSVRGQFQFQYQYHRPTSRAAAAFQYDIGRKRVHDHILPIFRHYSTSYHSEIDSDVDDESMARHNTLSRRLYRILLRTCKQGVELANSGSGFDTVTQTGNTDENEYKTWILLQPPMDQSMYGLGTIVEARRGKHKGEKEAMSTVNSNKAAHRMSSEEVDMAMEVLRFVHMSLGGNADDDLEEYYLTGNSNPSNGDGDDVAHGDDHIQESHGSAAAGSRHSEGHYTQFIDKDEERGEGDSSTKDDNAESDSDESETDEGVLESDKAVLVTVKDLQNAVRIAFRANLIPSSQSIEDAHPTSTIIARRHRDAIDACSQLSEQLSMWGNKSSISTDWERGVRVVATSSLMLKPTPGSKRYRFSYRIRVENISDIIDSTIDCKEYDSDACSSPCLERRAVQLLGRTWIISERSSQNESSSSVLQRLLEQGATELYSEKKIMGSETLRIVQTVNEPRTGAGTFDICAYASFTFAYPNSCSLLISCSLPAPSWPSASTWSGRGK